MGNSVGVVPSLTDANRSTSAALSSATNSINSSDARGTTDAEETPDFSDIADPKFHFEDAFKKIPSVLQRLHECRSMRAAGVIVPLRYLNGFTSSATYGEELSGMWVEKLYRHGVVPTALHLWTTLWKPTDYFKDTDAYGAMSKEEKESPAGQQAQTYISNFWQLCRLIWNSSDSSANICRQLVDCGVLEQMVRLISREDFNPKNMKVDNVRCVAAKAATGVIHNSLRFVTEEAKKRVRDVNIVTVLKTYLECDVPLLCTKVVILLAFIVNEDEIEIINTKEDILKTVINQLLIQCFEKENRRAAGFSLEEVLSALNALNAHDNNKLRSIELGAVPLYLRAIREARSNSETLAAVKGLWILSFHSSGQLAIADCVEELKKLEGHSDSNVRKAASGTLWNISGRPPTMASRRTSNQHKKAPKEEATKKKKKSLAAVPKNSVVVSRRRATSLSNVKVNSPSLQNNKKPNVSSATSAGKREKGGEKGHIATPKHVMISYDHQHQAVILKLNQALKEANYITWMDVDRISGSTLEAMADAVEQASVVIICMSDRYKNSPSCRTEAEYAYRLHKDVIPVRTEYKYQADGWLGLIMGTRLYFDCWTEDQVPACCARVVKELGVRGRIGADSATLPLFPILATTHAAVGGSHGTKNINESHKSLHEWTSTDVAKWLSGLSPPFQQRTVDALAAYDGSLLVELRALCMNNRETLLEKLVRDEFGLQTIHEVLIFSKHISSLN